MNPKERLYAVNNGMPADRIPFMPTILEHSAKLINKRPGEAARSEELIVEGHLRAYETYGHDLVTVGIDVYNIEAEALGCGISRDEGCSIPGIISHPYVDGVNVDDIKFSLEKGRIAMLLNAADRINAQIGEEVNIGVGICGPFSVAVELAGFENIISDCIYDADKVHETIKAVLEHQKNYSAEIIKRKLGITMFESWATLPLISPRIYSEFIMPYEKELIEFIKNSGLAAVPLIIGGDTSSILDDIIETGTTLVVADYNVDIGLYTEKASGRNLTVRANIDPKLVQRGPVEEILNSVENIVDSADGYDKFVLGTGVIPYDTPSENIIAVRNYLENAAI